MIKTRNSKRIGRPQTGLYQIDQFSDACNFSPDFEGKYCVYGLAASNEPEIIKYVGFTSNQLNCRYNMHQYDARKNHTPKQKWIMNLLNTGERIILVILEDGIETKEAACEAERKWISYLQEEHQLTNLTIGGLGTTGWRKKNGYI